MATATTLTYDKIALRDPGGVRGIQARWIIEGELKLETATRMGGRSGGPVDMPVLRDAFSGCPLLTGSTLAGALRSYLTDQIAGYGSRETEQVAQLFGGSRGDDMGAQSPLIVFDSLGRLPTGQPIEIRDSVKIVASRGTAEDHKKFDGEVLPAGTTFSIRFELLVPRPAVDGVQASPSEAELLALLLTAFDGLLSGDISLGARRSRGMGQLSVAQWKAKRFDFNTPQGWLDWLNSDAEKPFESLPAYGSAQEACGMQSAVARNFQPVTDQRKRVRITATLVFSSGLLVRSPSRAADAPDVVHLRSAGKSVLPGTSLAGVFRNRALRIARLLSGSTNKADEFVNDLFGPQLSGTYDPNFKPHASCVRISESFVAGGMRQRSTRIRIDRFTHSVFESAFFDEEPDCGGHFAVTFELRGPTPGQIGMFLLLVRDLLDGDLAVGGTNSVGRGIARGTAVLELLDESGQRRNVTLDPSATMAADDLEMINRKIQKLRDELEPPASGGAN